MNMSPEKQEACSRKKRERARDEREWSQALVAERMRERERDEGRRRQPTETDVSVEWRPIRLANMETPQAMTFCKQFNN